jgi:hypothetical protein
VSARKIIIGVGPTQDSIPDIPDIPARCRESRESRESGGGWRGQAV